MLNFNLLPGDKYDGRCAEIYITEKQFLIYHCSVCEEIYTTFAELLSHITKGHYGNTKELSKVNIKNVETVKKQETKKENQFKTNNLHVNTKKREEVKLKPSFSELLLKSLNETVKVNVPLEELSPHSSKSLSQRKKCRSFTSPLKSNNIGRTKVNTLTRYQANSNDDRKYICAICGFAFKEKYNLRVHLLRHSNQKNVSCSICSKKFLTKVELRAHEYRHKSERPYLCERCGMGFISSGSLVQHLRKHHHSLHHSSKCDQCFQLLSNFYQKDCNILHSDTCAECSQSIHNNTEHQETFCNIEKALVNEKNVTNTKQDSSYKDTKDGNLQERTIEGDFFIEQNLDEYELVQTLSDLECNKYV